MIFVNSILKKKGDFVFSVRPDETVFEALKFLSLKDIGAVLVMEGETLHGIFSERDYARKLILKGFHSKDTLVKDMMTKDLIVVNAQTNIMDCMTLMTEKHIRHLPVVENTKVIGIVTIGDIVGTILNFQTETISSLESYIYGGINPK